MIHIAFNPSFAHSLPEGHRFPMLKYELIPAQLIHEGLITEANLFSPGTLTEDEILLTHDMVYYKKLLGLALEPAAIRRIGFPLSHALIDREVCIARGTLDCAYYALVHGIAYNIAGGTHHAFTNRGEGFCLLNDQAIAANLLIIRNEVRQVMIVDLDVHQGNGTAQIFADQPQVYTFSVHGQNNYPYRKESSDLDIGLPDQIDDATYLDTLKKSLRPLLDHIKPDFIFYQAGVDILASDKFGKLAVSRQGCRMRDEFVLGECFARKIPVVVCMGGGYSPRLTDIVEAHCNTFRTGFDVFGP